MRPVHFLLGCASLLGLAVGALAAAPPGSSGTSTAAARSWVADNGNGTYSNPLFYEEFEDPDVIRVGDDYYLAGTTMHMNPGLVVMHSKDLVNWELASYCIDRLDLGPEIPTRGRKHLRPGHLGALHPLPRRHVLRLLQRQRRGHPGLSLEVAQRPVGTQPAPRHARPVGPLRRRRQDLRDLRRRPAHHRRTQQGPHRDPPQHAPPDERPGHGRGPPSLQDQGQVLRRLRHPRRAYRPGGRPRRLDRRSLAG